LTLSETGSSAFELKPSEESHKRDTFEVDKPKEKPAVVKQQAKSFEPKPAPRRVFNVSPYLQENTTPRERGIIFGKEKLVSLHDGVRG
jgi:hypothetical protein